MLELFCPQHGLPAILLWLVLGNDPGILYLTVQMYWAKLKDAVRRICGRKT
jgi:hypothetical protein